MKHLLLTCGLILASVAIARAGVLIAPCPTYPSIAHAMLAAKPGDTVLVEPGTYKEQIAVKSKVVLASRTPLGAILDGNRKKQVVSLTGGGEVTGFELRNGTVGVMSRGIGNVVTKCRIVNNWETGILCLGHLPKIEDNIIAFNRGSGIQGWDVRATAFPAIDHNTIAYNENHGIAIGGPSEIAVENNIIAFNDRLGMKISPEESKIRIVNNCFFANVIPAGETPAENYACDPMFVEPKKMNFTVGPQSPCLKLGYAAGALGARGE